MEERIVIFPLKNCPLFLSPLCVNQNCLWPRDRVNYKTFFSVFPICQKKWNRLGLSLWHIMVPCHTSLTRGPPPCTLLMRPSSEGPHATIICRGPTPGSAIVFQQTRKKHWFDFPLLVGDIWQSSPVAAMGMRPHRVDFPMRPGAASKVELSPLC